MKKLILFAFAICLLPIIALSQATRVSDSLTLVKFYQTTSGLNWKVNTNWPRTGSPAIPVKDWYGVTLELKDIEGKPTYVVSRLELRANEIGIIATTFIDPEFSLPDLKVLDLSFNFTDGKFPPLNNMPLLETLDISQNEFEGTIPDFNLPALKVLKINQNLFDGSIHSFARLQNLELLRADDNLLTGQVPNFNLPKLEELNLKNNLLEGELPNFANTNLRFLEIDENLLSGTIPSFNLPNLRLASMYYNRFTGIEAEHNVPALTTLNIDENLISFRHLEPLIAALPSNVRVDYGNQETVIPIKVTWEGESFYFTVNDDAPSNSYQWYLNNSMISGATDRVIEVPFGTQGEYYCEVNNSVADFLTLETERLTAQTLSNDRLDELVVSISPNPATNYISFQSPTNASAKIFSVNAGLAMEFDVNEGNNNVNIDLLPSGTYSMLISNGKSITLSTFVINK